MGATMGPMFPDAAGGSDNCDLSPLSALKVMSLSAWPCPRSVREIDQRKAVSNVSDGFFRPVGRVATPCSKARTGASVRAIRLGRSRGSASDRQPWRSGLMHRALAFRRGMVFGLALLTWSLAAPAQGQITTAYPLPTAGDFAAAITAGPDGNLWFTAYTSNNIGRITTGGLITEFPVTALGAYPEGITAGPDGNLWFTESG